MSLPYVSRICNSPEHCTTHPGQQGGQHVPSTPAVMPRASGVACSMHTVRTATQDTQHTLTFSGFMILWRRPTSKQSCEQGEKMADAGAVSWRVSPANARPWTLLLNLQQAAVRLPPPPAGSLLGSCTGRDAIQSKTSSQLPTTPAA